MPALPGYRVEKCIATGVRSDVYAGTREDDGAAVALKIFRSAPTSAQLDAEIRVLQACAGSGVPRLLDVPEAAPALVLERLAGRPLSSTASSQQPTLRDVLALASGLAELVGRIHDARVVHCAIDPSHLIVDTDGGALGLVGFGRATYSGSGHLGDHRRPYLGLPVYTSPEGTGRMDRGVDPRSDLYSIGAVLYELLKGEPPFASRDALELVHAHMARVPEPLESARPDLPRAVCQLVMRLLEKEPERRYPNARSLADDLAHCRAFLDSDGLAADELRLGDGDVPVRPSFSRRLYGRERELQVLDRALSKCASGTPELCLITGPLGVGKSTLATELRKRVGAVGGSFCIGSFDAERRDVPYLGWVTALQTLLGQRLGDSEERLSQLATRLRSSLGDLAGALSELVPDLSFVIGEVAPSPTVDPQHVGERLAVAVRRLLSVVAPPDEPLVLALDDLQWADTASLRLFEDVLRADASGAFLVVGVCHDEEREVRGLERTLARIAEGGLVVHTLPLGPLDQTSCTSLLAEALGRDEVDAATLAQIVERKTGNLPLLVRQFVDHAYDLGLFRFVSETGWVWEPAELADTEMPEDAVSIVSARIDRLDAPTSSTLEIASCMGEDVDTRALAHLIGGDRLGHGLERLCDEGLLRSTNTGFRFAHQRIREGAQRTLSSRRRAEIHYRIVRALRETYPDLMSRRVFDVADHMNRAEPCLPPEERAALVDVNVSAAKRALATGAAATARAYLEHARAAFRPEDWEHRPLLGVEILLHGASAAFQIGELDESLALLDELEQRPLSALQVAFVACQRMNVLAVGQNLDPVIRLGIATLRRFGVRFPIRPTRLRVYLATLRLDAWLYMRASRGLDLRPPRPDEIAPIILCGALGGPATRVDARLASLLSAWAGGTLLRLGHLRGPPLALASLAANRCALAADGRRARRYATLAEEIAERHPDPGYDHRARVVLHGHLYPWLRPRVAAVDALVPAIARAGELGDREFALYGSTLRTYARLFSGVPLDIAEREVREHHRSFAHRMEGTELTVHALRSLREVQSPAQIQTTLSSIDARFEGRASLSLYIRMPWILTLSVLGDPAAAFTQAEILGSPPVAGALHADLVFFRALACAALARDAAPSARRKHRRTLAHATNRLRRWSRHGPDFAHMVALLRAEQAALGGRVELARRGFVEARRQAEERGYVHHAALAAEREADLCQRLRRESEAARLLRDACRCYEVWSAAAKVEQLTKKITALEGG